MKNKSKKMAKGKKLSAPPTHSADLVLTQTPAGFTTTLSPDAEWAGIQKFVDMSTTEGAVSVGNWNFSNAQAPAAMGVNATEPGFYRGWCSDKVTYNVHVSNVIQIP